MRQQLFGHHLDDLLKPTKLLKRAHRSQDDRNDDGRVLHRERMDADFTRKFHLTNVVREEIQAHYQAGLLTVTLPKTVADSEGKIEIQ
ncbi:Hsp20 family protein [Lactiplantibacillus plantarum]|uniref:Hsp20 family protein n=1 Tax=Lactiplantibacillus plantarum TaxID=1590 RepID=UPI0007AB954D|nr:Hsp20 family protein [Lactiplantibacillus plantarum]ASX22301.1 hypothetical protein BGV74_11170 [Lactiplantibacillus plantarum]KZE03898.1 low molecular weight heat stress protein [Lactiplantibacillus plantarum]WMY71413.1 Hsp20 family protein [Lactiplantibacillus plantarum]